MPAPAQRRQRQTMSQPAPVGVALIGLGHWGKNLLRNLAANPRCRVRWLCDAAPDALVRGQRVCPDARVTDDFDEVLADPQTRAVVVATPAVTHFDLARRAIEAGRDVYVEKPLALRASEARALVELADRRRVRLMVGHLMLYHPCVQRLGEMISEGRLGQIYYMYTQRLNLGIVRQDENAWWSLAPHDISVIGYLFDEWPTRVCAVGQCFLQPGIEDVVFATLYFASGRVANIHVSWLDPHKIRRMTVVGSKQMVTFDDMEATEKIRVYDRGAVVTPAVESYTQLITLRIGDIWIPKVETAEPLAIEVDHFLAAIQEDRPVRTDGRSGLAVVQVLEAGQRSLESGGQPVTLQPGEA